MLARYDGCTYRRGFSNLARTLSRPGTEIAPVEVDTRIKRRHRCGYWWANCWASPPPHEIPSTSTSCCPTASSSCATRRARPRKRTGKRVGGDPPTPGTSKRIVPIFFLPTLSSASMKGSNTSRLAPMPLISRSGGPLPSPRCMATRTRVPLMLIVLVSVAVALRILSLLLVHIRPRCFNQGSIGAVANGWRGRLLGARAGEQPSFPILPPTTTVPGGPSIPGLRINRLLGIGKKGRLRVAGRVENALDVPTGTQDEFALAAQQPTGAITGLPRRNVVGCPGKDVRIARDLRDVDR